MSTMLQAAGVFLLFLSSFFSFHLCAQSKAELPRPWVAYPSAGINEYGVYHFRKTFSLEKIPEELTVHISADNRYESLLLKALLTSRD